MLIHLEFLHCGTNYSHKLERKKKNRTHDLIKMKVKLPKSNFPFYNQKAPEEIFLKMSLAMCEFSSGLSRTVCLTVDIC